MSGQSPNNSRRISAGAHTSLDIGRFILGGFLAGSATLVLTHVAFLFSKRFTPDPGTEGVWSSVLWVLPSAGVAVGAIFLKHRTTRLEWGSYGMIMGVVVANLWLVLMGGFLVGRPAFPGRPEAVQSLLAAIPDAALLMAEPSGYKQFSADNLNASKHGWQTQRIAYVGPEVEAPDVYVVSVNAIDALHWAATTRSDEGRCYGVLVVGDANNPRYGFTKWAILPVDSPCNAARVSEANATLRSPPMVK